MPSRWTVRGFATMTSSVSSASRLSGSRGSQPSARHAATGATPISLCTRAL